MKSEHNLFFQYRDEHELAHQSHTEAFRKLYYHLYSNSQASRAERIFEDAAKLLLLKVLEDRSPRISELELFMDGSTSANDALLPVLFDRFPDSMEDNDRFSLGDDAIRQGLRDLSGINLSEAPASVLGEAFQALIGPRLRGDKGQFFTPRTLVRAMVRVAQPQTGDKVVDPAAGTGGFLIETHTYRSGRHANLSSPGPLIGLEKDRDLARLGGAMVSIATDEVGTIRQANSLDVRALRRNEDPSPFDADIVLTNPPFGTKIGIADPNILEQHALGHTWAYSNDSWHRNERIRSAQDPQLLFLDLCMQLLKPGGLLGIVLPEGVYGNRKTGYVWDFLRSQGDIEAMIDCPRTTFQPGTDTKTNVLFVRKRSDTPPSRKTAGSACLVAVSKTCGHDRRGRVKTANGKPMPNDFEHIGKSYEAKNQEWWTPCQLTDPYYLVPRFYHSKAPGAVASLAKEWRGETASIGDLIEAKYISVRKGHEVGAEAYGTGDIPFVRTSDISNWEVSANATNGVSEEIYEAFREAQNLRARDVLLVVDGRYRIGRTAILHEHNRRSVVQSHFRILSVEVGSPVDSYELLYILSLPQVLEEMRNLVFIQSTLGSIGKRLHKLLLPIPERTPQWQERIGKFREAIEARARLLSELEEFETPEPEL